MTMGKAAEQTKKTDEIILTPLGTGGYIPVKERHTASFVFQKGNNLIILDFGTGVSRLLKEFDYLLSGVEKVTGFLSHYHPDHTIGLFYLPEILGPRGFELYAPGKGIYEDSAEVMLKRIFDTPFLPRVLHEMIPGIKINDIPLEGMDFAGMKVNFRVQNKHIHPSVAIRIGDYCVYCTDTEPEYETIGFAMGAKVLMHECWYKDKIPDENISSAQIKDLLGMCGRNGHSSNLGVALIGRESRVESIYTVHHHPAMKDTEISRMVKEAAVIAMTEMAPCNDGMTIQCGL